jgi:hypothetical protein
MGLILFVGVDEFDGFELLGPPWLSKILCHEIFSLHFIACLLHNGRIRPNHYREHPT